ncbi:hypothetical protein [Coleofasciculus sp. C1-SOL-03]|uniref:hypothetical protein n=1 Tax=Coleofasciculus sp. C1-SOL-03 TaxID=3069522 RepID=UPI004062F74B
MDYGPNVKTGGSTNWHWNQTGAGKTFGIADHTVASPRAANFGRAMKYAKPLGRGALAVGAGMDAYSLGTEINQSVQTGDWDNTVVEGSRIAGGWAGAYGGAKALGAAGAGIGTLIAPGIGTAASNMTELPTILNRTDIEEHFPDPFDAIDDDEMDERLQARDKGKQVRLIGQYIQVDVRRWPKPPPRYKGHVAVVLEDGTEVFLYPPWHSEAIRSANEITRYNNRGVTVVGKIVPECPKSPQPAASIVAPCMLTIDFINLVD